MPQREDQPGGRVKLIASLAATVILVYVLQLNGRQRRDYPKDGSIILAPLPSRFVKGASWRSSSQNSNSSAKDEGCFQTGEAFSVPYPAHGVAGEKNAYYLEVQEFVAAGLRELGLPVNRPAWPECLGLDPARDDSCQGRTSVVTFSSFESVVPTVAAAPHVILFNMEVFSDANRALFYRPEYVPRWRQWAVWDYSPGNLVDMAAAGLIEPDASAAIPLGYYPGIVTGDAGEPVRASDAGKDIDVLFLGGVNDRRSAVLGRLRAQGVSVHEVHHNLWGEEREALIRRARVLLNVHFFDALRMEAVRLFLVLSIGTCTVSEDSPDATAMALWSPGVEMAPYERVADRVLYMLRNDSARLECAQKGYRHVRRQTPAQAMRAAVGVALSKLRLPHTHVPCK